MFSFDPKKAGEIPDGHWQLIAGIVFAGLGLFGCAAAEPGNGAASFGAASFSLAGCFFFWSIILRCFSHLEAKLDRLIYRTEVDRKPD